MTDWEIKIQICLCNSASMKIYRKGQQELSKQQLSTVVSKKKWYFSEDM
jgi:hypothetical protein